MRAPRIVPALLAILAAFAALPAVAAPKPIAVTSPAFAAQGVLPARFTCDGAGVSPPLRWSGVPDDARSLVLVVSDPDAPYPTSPRRHTWVHWVLYNIPPSAPGLDEQVAAADLPAGTREGVNGWQRTGYGGACPPRGTHRYIFRLFALDTVLPDLGAPDRSRLARAMAGHVIATGFLVGTYARR